MKAYLHIFVLYALAGTYKLLESAGLLTTWLTSYLEDLLVMPLMLLTAQVMINKLTPAWKNFKIDFFNVIIITTGVSIYFEGLIPTYDDRFTADPWDIACYVTGSIIFLLLNNAFSTKKVNHFFG